MMEIGNTEFIIRMIRKNRGISYLPLFAVREYAENGELTILDAADFRLAMYQQVIYHKNKWMTKEMDAFIRFLQFYYSEGVYENILEIMNGNSVTVRRVNMPDTPDRRIMEAAYEGKPVHTELLLKEAQPTDGFIAFYDQMLVGPFKGHSFYIMDDNGECIYSVDSTGTGKAADSMASLIPSMNQGTGSLLKDGNYVVYERPEPYGWTVAAKVPQDQVLNMGSTVRYTAVFLGAVFLALLCLYCHNYISLHLYKDAV